MLYRRSKDATSVAGVSRSDHERLTGIVEGNVRVLEDVVPTVRDLQRRVEGGDEPPPAVGRPDLRVIQGGRARRAKWALEAAAAVLLVAGFTVGLGPATGPAGRPQSAQAAGTSRPSLRSSTPPSQRGRTPSGRMRGGDGQQAGGVPAATSSTAPTGPVGQAPGPVEQQPAAISPVVSTPTSMTLPVAEPTSTTLLPVDVPTTTVCVNPKGKPCDSGGDVLGG